VRQNICLEVGARPAIMCGRLRKEHHDEYILCKIECYTKKWMARTHLFA
jgi:hypothetical protein